MLLVPPRRGADLTRAASSEASSLVAQRFPCLPVGPLNEASLERKARFRKARRGRSVGWEVGRQVGLRKGFNGPQGGALHTRLDYSFPRTSPTAPGTRGQRTPRGAARGRGAPQDSKGRSLDAEALGRREPGLGGWRREGSMIGKDGRVQPLLCQPPASSLQRRL